MITASEELRMPHESKATACIPLTPDNALFDNFAPFGTGMQPCAQLFTIAARAQTTAYQLFRASLSGPQTRMRSFRFRRRLACQDRCFRRAINPIHGVLDCCRKIRIYLVNITVQSLPRSVCPNTSQAANDPQTKRPLSQSMPASPPHAGSCDKQRIFPPSCPAGTRALRLSQTPLVDFLDEFTEIANILLPRESNIENRPIRTPTRIRQTIAKRLLRDHSRITQEQRY